MQQGFEPVGESADAATSASTVDRPDLRRLLDDEMSGKPNVVAIESFQRLSRDMAEVPALQAFRRQVWTSAPSGDPTNC